MNYDSYANNRVIAKFPHSFLYRVLEDYPKLKLKWWWFARIDFDTDIYYTWRHSYYWKMLFSRYIKRPIFSSIIKLKIYKVREGDYYRNGKFKLPWK